MRASVIGLAMLVAACSKSPNSHEKLNTFDVEEPAPASAPGIKGPQIAYSYTIGYRLARNAVAPVQARHTALCQKLGPQRCFVLESRIDTAEQGDTSASTTLLVDARLAGSFGNLLDEATTGAGGSIGNRQTNAEDVTKQVIDTDAKLRAKEALAERLLALIRTANGRVGDLVEAEKAYATTQEELAATRSLQAELKQRVAMSRYDLTYSSIEATGTFSPVRTAVSSAGATIASSLGALLTFVLLTFPWALTLAAIIWLLRRLGVRGPIAWWRARHHAP